MRTSALYRDVTSALVDPTGVSVEIIDPSGSIFESGVPVRDSLGQFHYDFTVPADAVVGTWAGRFFGTIDGATYAADDEFTVTSALGSGLVTLEFYKDAMGITGTATDRRDQSAIIAASQAVRDYTDRSFEVSDGSTLAVKLQHPEDNILEIDDCVSVVSITTDAGVPNGDPITLTDGIDYIAEPVTGPVFFYVMLFNTYRGYSPEMGFVRNLDRIPYARRPAMVTVTAAWGWPSVPEPVKWAVIETARALSQDDAGEYQSESIDTYSRSKSARFAATGLPSKALDLLAPYVRIDA